MSGGAQRLDDTPESLPHVTRVHSECARALTPPRRFPLHDDKKHDDIFHTSTHFIRRASLHYATSSAAHGRRTCGARPRERARATLAKNLSGQCERANWVKLARCKSAINWRGGDGFGALIWGKSRRKWKFRTAAAGAAGGAPRALREPNAYGTFNEPAICTHLN
ncbi:hypothetical protein EVAR_30841_1 [Eumeta japonica]|uniref:Uncharacterized protein n=1 Tax=Eumeta variegata TaxID=151549 RepID=A0A4C1XRV2_EUMVA|nr:hypothetical protein EVAR_30841_1 [Eumeta japonica]